ncbi:unnamed protein product [Brassica oleracea]
MARVDCSNLDRSSSPSFPYYGDWNFGVDSNLKPKICITTSTTGLDQILPWMFYHKVLRVSTFFLFVEGKAATPTISKVLESIPLKRVKNYASKEGLKQATDYCREGVEGRRGRLGSDAAPYETPTNVSVIDLAHFHINVMAVFII